MSKQRKAFGWSYLPEHRRLELGAQYIVYGHLCRFIKVTPKGYNFLNEYTNKCVFPQHLYDKKYRGIPVPSSVKFVETTVNRRAGIKARPAAKTG